MMEESNNNVVSIVPTNNNNNLNENNNVVVGLSSSQSTRTTHLDILERLEREFCCLTEKGSRNGGAASYNYNSSSGVVNNNNYHPKWTLYHDAQMASLLQQFTKHVQKRSADVSDAILGLDDKIRNQLENDIVSTRDEVYQYSNRHYVKNTIVPTTTTENLLNENKTFASIINSSAINKNNSSSSNEGKKEQHQHQQKQHHQQENLAKEDMNDNIIIDGDFDQVEEMAILDGMKALEIYYHPDYDSDHDDYYNNNQQQPNNSVYHNNKNNNNNNFNKDHFFQMEDEGGLDVEDSCYYYESCKKDIFNQRPLPYIISTPEFQQSKDIGLGSDDDDNDNDAFYNISEKYPNELEDNKDLFSKNQQYDNHDEIDGSDEIITNIATNTTPVAKNNNQNRYSSTLEQIQQ